MSGKKCTQVYIILATRTYYKLSVPSKVSWLMEKKLVKFYLAGKTFANICQIHNWPKLRSFMLGYVSTKIDLSTKIEHVAVCF